MNFNERHTDDDTLLLLPPGWLSGERVGLMTWHVIMNYGTRLFIPEVIHVAWVLTS